MNASIYYRNRSRKARLLYSLSLSSLFISVLLVTGLWSTVKAQAPAPQYSQPSWWFGIAGAANVNFYRGSTQRLTPTLIAPVAFHQGLGLGAYVAPLVEFHRPTSNWGLGLQVGYDSRRGAFERQFSPCNCPLDLSTRLSYVTVEPTVRFSPFKSSLFLFAGPRVAFLARNTFVYEQGINPEFPEQTPIPDITGSLSDVNTTLVSAQVGAGVDIRLSEKGKKTQWVFTPFASYQPYFGQNPRDIETWSVQTLRIGGALKLGQGRLIPAAEVSAPVRIEVAPEPEPDVQFTTYAPAYILEPRQMRESFPLRNYIFFDNGSTEIPKRYVLLRENQVDDFNSEPMEMDAPKKASDRSERQMIVYSNTLNILGDRMSENPGTSIHLVGSSENGADEGRAMAVSVKTYLVDVWDIEPDRITVEGRTRPEAPADSDGADEDIALRRDDDRRVAIESSSPILLTEFHSLTPVEIVATQDAPVESNVTFTAGGAEAAFSSWTVEARDENGRTEKFGPYTQETVNIPGTAILDERAEGDYTFTLEGKTKRGNTVVKTSTAHLTLAKAPVEQEVLRYSVLYEFDESKADVQYEKFLTEVVAPKIPQGGTVVLHGYTDIIGEEDHNHQLSHDRAANVKDILQSALTKAGRSDVRFEVYGFGEDPGTAPFENKHPEGRFYNRTVVIDIVPAR